MPGRKGLKIRRRSLLLRSPGFVAPEHIGADEEGMPAKGRALIRSTRWADGSVGPLCWFRCPRNRLYCGVPVKPSPPNSRGYAWDMSGTDDAPTIMPSINCDGVGCGWHGFIRDGIVA